MPTTESNTPTYKWILLGHYLEHFESALFPLGLASSAVTSITIETSSFPIVFTMILTLTPLTKLMRLFSSLVWIKLLKKHSEYWLLFNSIILTGVSSLCSVLTLLLPANLFLPAIYLCRLLHQTFSSIETPLAESLCMQKLEQSNQQNKTAEVGSLLDTLTILGYITASCFLGMLLKLKRLDCWPALYLFSALASFALIIHRYRQFARYRAKGTPREERPAIIEPKRNPSHTYPLLQKTLLYFFGYFTFFFTTSYLTFVQLLTFPASASWAFDRHTTFLVLNLICIQCTRLLIRRYPLPASFSKIAICTWCLLCCSALIEIALYYYFTHHTHLSTLKSLFWGIDTSIIYIVWTLARFSLLMLSATTISILSPWIRHHIWPKNTARGRPLCLSHTIASSLGSFIPLITLLPFTLSEHTTLLREYNLLSIYQNSLGQGIAWTYALILGGSIWVIIHKKITSAQGKVYANIGVRKTSHQSVEIK